MEEPFTATDARQAMAAGDGFTQAAAMRAAGLTWMLWGLALPLAAAAMRLGAELTVDVDDGVRFRFEGGWGVIGPVVVLGWAAVVTGFIWHAFAVRPDSRLRPAVSLAVHGIVLPLLASALWFIAFVAIVLGPERSPEDHWLAVEWAFVLAPAPLVVAGLWLAASAFGPWLGSRCRLTLGVAALCMVLGIALNATRLWDVALHDVSRTGPVLLILGGVGAYLYLRG